MRRMAFIESIMRWAADAVPPDQVRRAVDEVFKRPEFGEQVNWWLIALKPLIAFFRWLGTLSSVDPILFWVIFIGSLLLLVLMILLIVFQLRSAFATSSRRPGAKAAAAERARRSAECRALATDCAARGDYTEAVRQLFLSLVYLYDEKGRINFRQAYTNREYLGLLDDQRDARAGLQLFVDALDDHWYGQSPTDRSLYEACRVRYEALAP
ncbi:MAG: DUF4129 domain-containing protein [Gemmataceae bacterium]